MKVSEIKEEKMPPTKQVVYKVILVKDVVGSRVYWETNVPGWSKENALQKAKERFKEQLGAVQEAMLGDMDVNTITAVEPLQAKSKLKKK